MVGLVDFDRAFGVAAIAAEASSESELCQQAIAGAMRNRVRSGRFEPTIAGVVVQPYQFSEFLSDVSDNRNLERVVNLPPTAPEIITAAAAYDAVMADENIDPSQDATHFFADGIPIPKWALSPAKLTVKIGRFNFYKDVP